MGMRLRASRVCYILGGERFVELEHDTSRSQDLVNSVTEPVRPRFWVTWHHDPGPRCAHITLRHPGISLRCPIGIRTAGGHDNDFVYFLPTMHGGQKFSPDARCHTPIPR